MRRYDHGTNIADFDAVRLAIASPTDILDWSHGEVLKPETNMLQQTSMVYQNIEPPSTYKPLDPLPFLTKDVNNEINPFFDTGSVNYAPF